MAESPPSDYMDVDGAGGDASFPVNGETPTNGYAFDAMDGPSPVKKAKYDPDVINQKIPMILVNGQSHTTVDNNGVPLDVLVHHVPQNADLQNLHPIKISSVVHGGFSEGSEDEQSSTVTSSEDVHQPKAEEPVASVAAAAETNGQPAELVEEQGPTAVHAVTSNISTITISSDEGMLPPAKTAPKPIQPTVGFGYHSDEPSSDESVAQKAPEPVPSYAEIIGDLIPTCSSHILPIRRIGKRIIVEPWWKPYKGYTIDGRFCHFFNGFAVPPCDVPGPPNDSFRVHESMSVAKTGANYCIDDYETLDGCDKKVQTGITVYMEHDFDLDEEFPELKLDEKTVVSLPTHAVCFGRMRSRVVSKKLEVINGNLLFQFEILVPASDKMAKSKAFDRFEDTVEVAELSLSMEHVSDIIFPYPKESLGAVAVMIFLTDFGVSRMQNFFRSLNAPAYIWNDASYKAFTFEIPYNFFQDYERIMMFMRVCNGWAALLPTISGAICGFGQVKLFDDVLTDADVNLKTVPNSTGYHCYQFEVNTGTDSPKRKHDFKFRPYPYRPIAIAVPEHRIMFYPSDMKGLRENSWLNDDVVDFVMQDMIANLPKEDRDRITYMEPHNFSMFLGNSKLNHFDAKTIKNDMAKMVDDLNERTRIPIDMFKKDFFFLPICMRDHWFGVIVINPGGAIVGGKKARKKSTILILDSLRKHINHNHTKWNIRAFLTLLFKALQSYTKIHAHLSYDYNWIDMNNQLPLPIQPNTYDCGIYMLMFYQLFVDSLPTKEDPLVLRNKWDTMDSDKYRMVIHDRIVTVGGFKDFALPSLYRRTDPRKFRRKKRREELKNSAPSYEPVVPVAAEESSSAYSLV